MTAPTRAYVDWILKRLERATLLALRNDHPDPLIALAIEDEILMRRAARNRESGDSIPEAAAAAAPEVAAKQWPPNAQPPVLNKSGGSDVEGK